MNVFYESQSRESHSSPPKNQGIIKVLPCFTRCKNLTDHTHFFSCLKFENLKFKFKQARRLYDTYLSDDAPQRIDIPPDMLAFIRKELDNGAPNLNVFTPPQAYVFDTLQGTWERVEMIYIYIDVCIYTVCVYRAGLCVRSTRCRVRYLIYRCSYLYGCRLNRIYINMYMHMFYMSIPALDHLHVTSLLHIHIHIQNNILYIDIINLYLHKHLFLLPFLPKFNLLTLFKYFHFSNVRIRTGVWYPSFLLSSTYQALLDHHLSIISYTYIIYTHIVYIYPFIHTSIFFPVPVPSISNIQSC